LSAMLAHAQLTPDAELKRRQTQQQEQAKSRASTASDVFTPTPAQTSSTLVLPQESPCFRIQHIIWQGTEPFSGLRAAEALVRGKCIGSKGLGALQSYLARQLIDQGYVTSRILIPEQNLASGRLILQAVPGRLGKVRDEGRSLGWHVMALPEGSGELLNQRDLDQALENIRRLPGQQDAAFDLVPGARQGETDLVIQHAKNKRWRALVTLDDSGSSSTGKYQLPLHRMQQPPPPGWECNTIT